MTFNEKVSDVGAILSEGIRIFLASVKTNIIGIKKFSGNDDAICQQIIEGCYNIQENYFMTTNSDSSYPEFYARDFGWCVEALMNLGYKDLVIRTLDHALSKYSNDGIKVAITPSGRPFNFPDIYSPDSTAYFFRSLRIAGAKSLIIKHKQFLNGEIRRFEEVVIDKVKSIVKDENFSGMRDYEIRHRSCYDMIMACMLDMEVDRINKMLKTEVLKNTLRKHNLKKNLIKYYWNGKYFDDALEDARLTGHCNVYPYWLGVITDKKMMKSSIKSVVDADFDKPFPLIYGHSPKTEFIWSELFVKGWEKETMWAMLGMAYIDVVSKFDRKKAAEYISMYGKHIEKYGAFMEVFRRNGTPYKTFFYHSATSMLWASMYLDLKMRLKVQKNK
jgi:hypothetical protein